MNSLSEKIWKDIRKDVYVPQGELALCQGVILPVLQYYGWDVFNTKEVVPQFDVGGGKVDYCLKAGQKNAVFIEVKRFSEDLRVHQEQLLNYAFQEGVPMAILTNGQVWWFYLPLTEGSWEQRKFLTVDIIQQNDLKIEEHFTNFLQKEAIIKGAALDKARTMHSSRTRKKAIQVALPQAWQNLIDDQDDVLMDLLADKVEGLCGLRPDAETVSNFMLQLLNDNFLRKFPNDTALEPKEKENPGVISKPPEKKRKAVRRPVSYTLLGQVYSVNTSRDLLLSVCQKLWDMDPAAFHNAYVSGIKGVPKFTEDKNALHSPHAIGDRGLYVEMNRSSIAIEKQCIKLAEALGYVLSIEWNKEL